MASTVKVSIVIPTHNRADDVIENVDALLPQISGLPFEIIVVDSASSSDTMRQLEGICKYPQTVLYRSDLPGASLARNIGVSKSAGAWLSFLDDDAVVHPHWATNLLRRIEQCDETMGLIAGRVVPRWPKQGYEIPPNGLGTRARILLSVLDSDQSFEMTTNPNAISANMFVRRSTFDRIGGFPVEMGRVGQVLASGEDAYLTETIVRSGFRAWYDGSIGVDHKISSHRMTHAWLAQRALHEGGVSYRRLTRASDRIPLIAKCIATYPILALMGRSYDDTHECLIRFHHNRGLILSATGRTL
jgi:glycosyltransferase involved in cell wall biosynthesis